MKFLLRSVVTASLLTNSLAISDAYSGEMAEGMNVVVTSADHQTQMMAMVLSLQTIKGHGKDVHMTLCGPAGDLALKNTSTPELKPLNASPTMFLQKIIGMGAKVEVCPLYLPNKGKNAQALMQGISVANPKEVAARLLDKAYQNLTY